jgi:hypothetical protein
MLAPAGFGIKKNWGNILIAMAVSLKQQYAVRSVWPQTQNCCPLPWGIIRNTGTQDQDQDQDITA